ncbi:hypothetical protein [Nocardia sp. IFM 10818]
MESIATEEESPELEEHPTSANANTDAKAVNTSHFPVCRRLERSRP